MKSSDLFSSYNKLHIPLWNSKSWQYRRFFPLLKSQWTTFYTWGCSADLPVIPISVLWSLSVLKPETITDHLPYIVLRRQHEVLVEGLWFPVLIFHSSVSFYNDWELASWYFVWNIKNHCTMCEMSNVNAFKATLHCVNDIFRFNNLIIHVLPLLNLQEIGGPQEPMHWTYIYI